MSSSDPLLDARGCRDCPALVVRTSGPWPTRCPDCRTEWEREYQRAYRERNREELARRARANYIERTYGLTPEEFDSLKYGQADVCAICTEPPRTWHVDHDHSSGAIRGLLCETCNRGLGHFRDNTALLANAISYLERSAA